MTDLTFPVEAGAVMQFARAIGDPNPAYFDADHARASEAGRVIAPPTFTMSVAQWEPTTPLRPTPGEPWRGSGREATGIPLEDGGPAGVGLHAEQHFEYHLPVGPGDVLTATDRAGETWEREGRRGGHMRFVEVITEFRNQDGELAITSRRIGVRIDRSPTEDTG